jgi:putative DNA primase/helicase
MREVYELRKYDAQAKAKASLKKGVEIDFPQVDEPEVPIARRYIVNDVTYKALGQILADNPNGVLAYRDEMVSMLKSLDREEWAAPRGFFLSAWDGKGGYTFDRITCGKTRIDTACLSMLGSTQPGRIAEYIRRATGGAGDDGLIQRFGLLVWPDQDPEWIEADRYPNAESRDAAWSTFKRLTELTPDAVKAETDQFGTIPFLRLDKVARGLFAEWHRDHELRLRSGTLHPALESHLSKYRKLVPALALINHLSDGNAGPVNDVAILRAIAMSHYFESHAVRLYAAGTEAETSAAKAILAHIRRGDLTDGFTARDVHQRDWSNLTDKDQVRAGLALLEEYDWIAGVSVETGGRPRKVYRINPRGGHDRFSRPSQRMCFGKAGTPATLKTFKSPFRTF